MLPQCSHITRKRGVFYYRRRLPRPHRGEIALSLRTRHFREAEHLGYILDRRFESIASNQDRMSNPDVAEVLRRYLQEGLEEERQTILRQAADRHFVQRSSAVDEDDEDLIERALEVIDLQVGDLREALARRDIEQVRHEAERLMAENGLTDDQRVPLSLGILQVGLQLLEARRQLVLRPVEPILLDVPSATPAASMPADQPPPEPPVPTGPLLSEVLPRFLDFMVVEEGWRRQTLAQSKATYTLFTAVCGDRPVQAYTRRDLTLFYDTLRGLPALWAKKPEWKKVPPVELVERTREQRVDRLTMKTVKRHFSAMGRLFTYLIRRGEFEGANPAHNFEFPTKGRARDRRQMWQGEKLRQLFSSPVWQGCRSKSHRSQPGELVIRDEKFWLPLLGLFHGNRLEEFAQLRRSDIGCEGGIWFFDINDADGKQLKNEQSVRRVPIHPKIIALGFLDYLDEAAPRPADRVFPALKGGGADNKLGHAFTKWWGRYRTNIGLHEKGLDYHSFRHGVTTKLNDAGVPSAHIDQLIGHEGKTTAERVYNKGASLPTLYAAICKIDWPELPL